MEQAHTPTRVTGTAKGPDADVTFDYVGCTVCRIDHPILGSNIPQPWHKAHSEVLPPTATQDIPDGSTIRR